MKTDRVWNKIYEKLSNKAKYNIKKDTCIKFYNKKELLYLETDVSSICLGAVLLQVSREMNITHEEAPENAALTLIVFDNRMFIQW